MTPVSPQVGVSSFRRGNVNGSLPEGSTLPNRTLASAAPPASPGYHASMIAATLFFHGIRIGLPLSITTIVCGLAVATASTSSFWFEGFCKLRVFNSPKSSPAGCATTTIATSDLRASATASAISPGLYARKGACSSWTPENSTSLVGDNSLIAFVIGTGIFNHGFRHHPQPLWSTNSKPSQLWNEPVTGCIVSAEPPPDITATSAWEPMTAIRFSLDAGSGS